MTETKSSQAQHETPWKSFFAEPMGWAEGMLNEAARMEAAGSQQAVAAIDEMGRLAKESLTYGLKVSAEWRKLSADSMRKAADALFTPKA